MSETTPPLVATPRLVYVEDSWAWFTTRPDWQEQWGDDWNDAPYEHNAGEPYTWKPYMAERGVPHYEIVKVAWDGADLRLPRDGFLNSPWSVQQINAGAIAWLMPPDYSDALVAIMAGTTLHDFIGEIHGQGGTVYMPLDGARTKARQDG